MRAQTTSPGVLSGIAQAANPVFIVLAVGVPVGALTYALTFGSLTSLNYVHILAGALWTGIDLYLGFVLGPVLGAMDAGGRVAVFRRLMPKMTFLMPVLAGVTVTSGIELTSRLGLPFHDPKIIAAFAVTGILSIQGFGILLPNEIRIFRELLSERPDTARIAQLGMRNAKLGGIQGVFQLAIFFIMAILRFA